MILKDIVNVSFLPQTKHHSHRSAAAFRTSVSHHLIAMARRLGGTPYVVSPTVRDSNEEGLRLAHWGSDIQLGVLDTVIRSDHIIIMVDCDYYTEFPEWLALGLPVLLYTFAPDSVGGGVADGNFSVSDNLITYNMSGGQTYGPHPIWNHGSASHVYVVSRDGGLVVHNVEFKLLAEDPSRR